MGQSFDLSGAWLLYLFYAVSLAAFVPLAAAVAWPLDDLGNVALALLFASLFVAAAVGAWRRHAGKETAYLAPAQDIANDPFAYPGQAAKQRWERAVRRLPGTDDEDD